MEEPSNEDSLCSQAHGAVVQLLNSLAENLKYLLNLIGKPEETVERIFSSEASNGNNIELQKFLLKMVQANAKADWRKLESALVLIGERDIASKLVDILAGESKNVLIKDVISDVLNNLGGSWRFFLRLLDIPEEIVQTISPDDINDCDGKFYKLVAEKLHEDRKTGLKQIEDSLMLLQKNNLADKYKSMMACVVLDESKEDQQEVINHKTTEADQLSEFIKGLGGDWKFFLRLIDVPEQIVVAISESERKIKEKKLYNLLTEKLLTDKKSYQKDVENMLILLGKNNLIPILKKMNSSPTQESKEDPIFELLKGLEEDLQFFLKLIDIPKKTIDSIVLNQSNPESAKEFVDIMQPWKEADFRKMESALILMHKYELSSKIEAIKARNFKSSNSSNATIDEGSLSRLKKQIEKAAFASMSSYWLLALSIPSDTSKEKVSSSNQNEETSYGMDIIHEISSRVTEWKAFGKVLDIEKAYLKNLELIDDESLTKEQLVKRNTDLMMEAVKSFREKKRAIDENSWEFWKNFLLHFQNGRDVIANMESAYPMLSSDLVDSTLKETSSEIEEPGNHTVEKSSGFDAASNYLFDGSEVLITEVCHNKVCSKWEFIGAFLCIDFENLRNIAENLSDCEERLRKVFEEKIMSDAGLNWPSIQRALKCVGADNLISELKKNYEKVTQDSRNDNLEKPNWTYFMAYLSQRVSGFWVALAGQLEIEDSMINIIKKDRTYHSFESKAFAILQIAYNQQEVFNWNIVSKALKKCRRWDVVRKIESNEEFFHLTR